MRFLTPDFVRNNMSERDQRKLYSRLRKNAMKRLKNLSGTEFERAQAYRENRKGFPKLSEMRENDLAYYLTEVSDFIYAKSSTLRYQKTLKNRNIRSWRGKGLNVNEENYWDFVDFLEAWHANNQEKLYGSERVYELMEDLKEKKLGIDDIAADFAKWLAKSKELERLEPVEGESAEYYREKLGI